MSEISVEIGAQACTLVGAEPITSFEDGSAESLIIANNYDPIVDNEVDLYDWRFLMKEVQLVASEMSEEQSWRWKSMYSLPSDCYGVRALRDQGGRRIAFDRFEDKVGTSSPSNLPVFLEYTRRLDESMWPKFFQQLIVYQLAAILASGLREDYKLAELWEGKTNVQRRMSRNRDAQMSTTRNMRTDNLLRVRHGASNTWTREGW